MSGEKKFIARIVLGGLTAMLGLTLLMRCDGTACGQLAGGIAGVLFVGGLLSIAIALALALNDVYRSRFDE